MADAYAVRIQRLSDQELAEALVLAYSMGARDHRGVRAMLQVWLERGYTEGMILERCRAD